MKYAEALPDDFKLPGSMFWIKKDLEKNPFELLPLRRGDTVMDCGSCIGTFAIAALEQKAKRVVCYEPIPKNIAVLKENLARYGNRAELIQAALISGNATSVDMYLSGFSGASSIVARKNAKTLPVRAVSFRNELKRIRPDVIKLDIEGGEYDLLCGMDGADFAGVSAMFIEFHPHPKRENFVALIKQFLMSNDFNVINERLRAWIAVRSYAADK